MIAPVPTTTRLVDRYQALDRKRAQLPPATTDREREQRATQAEREKDVFHAYNIVLVLMDAQAGVLETQGHRGEARAMRAMAARVEVRGIYALLGAPAKRVGARARST